MAFKNDHGNVLLQPCKEGQQYKKNTAFIFDGIHLFGMLCDFFSLPITCTFKKLAAPFPFEVLSNHVVSDTKAYRAVPTAL